MFIVLEGIDGCGKSTQAKLLVEALRGKGIDVAGVRDPGSSEAGETIRGLCLNPFLPLCPKSLILLYSAARLELARVIEQHLAEKRWVVCDRWLTSTLVYQCKANALHENHALDVHRKFIDLIPDLEILFEVPIDVASERIQSRTPDRFESKGKRYFTELAAAYKREFLKRYPRRYYQPERFIVGHESIDAVHREVLGVINSVAGIKI